MGEGRDIEEGKERGREDAMRGRRGSWEGGEEEGGRSSVCVWDRGKERD